MYERRISQVLKNNRILAIVVLFALLATMAAVPTSAQEPYGVISGTVFQSDGVTPIGADAWVEAFDASTYNFTRWTEVGEDGTYSLLILPGIYKVSARGDHWALEYYNEAGLELPYGDNVVVTAGATTPDIDFTLDPGGTVSGVVYEADGITPIANMNVSIDDTWLGECTAADGSYTIYSAPLDVGLKVYSGGGNWCGGPSFLEEWWQESPSWETATPVTLTGASPDAIGIDFTLQEEDSATVYLPIVVK